MKSILLSLFTAVFLFSFGQDEKVPTDNKLQEFYFTINGGERIYPDYTFISAQEVSPEDGFFLSIIGTKDHGTSFEKSASASVGNGMLLQNGATQFFNNWMDSSEEYDDNTMEYVTSGDDYGNFFCSNQNIIGMMKITQINMVTKRVTGFFRGRICNGKTTINLDCRFTNWPFVVF